MKKPSIKSKIAKNKLSSPKSMTASIPMGGMKPPKNPMMGMKKGGVAKKPGLAIMIAIGKPKGRGK